MRMKEFIKESAPKGWEGTVKAMKKHKEIDNPWALAHYMKNKGYKSHKNESVEDRTSYQVAKELASKGIKYDPAREDDLVKAIGMVLIRELNMSPRQARAVMNDEDFLSDTMGELRHMSNDEDDEWYDKHGRPDPNGAYDAGGHYHLDRDLGEDHEIQMADSELKSIYQNSRKLLKLIQHYSEQEGLEAWQQSKITKAADYLNSVLQSISGQQTR